MMRARLIALRERRALLAARAESERARLGGYVAHADAALAWVERGRSAVQEAARHPWLLAAGVLVLFALRPKRVLRLAASGWSLWQVVRRLQRWWSSVAPGEPGAVTRAP